VDGSIGTYGGEQKSEQGLSMVNLRERDRLEDLGVDGSVILKLILRK
jgi:hypothetical protein